MFRSTPQVNWHKESNNLWCRHAFWRGLQKTAVWVALLSPAILLFLTEAEGFRMVVYVWLIAVGIGGVAHFARRHAIAKLRNHHHKHNDNIDDY